MSGRRDDQKASYRVKTALKQDQALKMWVAGSSYDTIATTLGWASRSGAYQAVTVALTRFNEEAEARAEHGRAIAIARLRPLWIRAMENVNSVEGSAKDITAALQVADRLARLEGVKDPAHEIRLTVQTELDREIAMMTEAVQRAGGIDLAAVLDGPARQ